jgi:hypothetical protein
MAPTRVDDVPLVVKLGVLKEHVSYPVHFLMVLATSFKFCIRKVIYIVCVSVSKFEALMFSRYTSCTRADNPHVEKNETLVNKNVCF